MKHTTPILRVFSVMAAAALCCCACQEEAPEINYTVIVTNDFSKVVEAINDGTFKQTEAVAKLTAAIDRLNADQAGKLQAVMEMLTSVNNTLALKLAAVEAAIKSQTLSMESKLQLIETAIKALPDYTKELEAIKTIIDESSEAVAGKLDALKTVLESQTLSMETKLAAIEAALKVQTLAMESKLQLIKEAIEALPDYSDQLAAIKAAIAALPDYGDKLEAIKAAIQAIPDYNQKLDAVAAALDAITAQIAAEGDKLPELKAAIESITASIHDLMAEVENGHTDVASALAQIIAKLDALRTPGSVSVTGVSLNKTTQSLEAGDSEILTATVMPEDATNKNVTWTSDNEAVATVDSTGKVTAVSAGTATITVTTEDGGKTATCTVTVTPSGGGEGNLTFTVGEGENAVTFEMAPVAGGTFLMGSQKTDENLPNYFADADDDESPVHQVTLTQNYWMGKYEVTQGLWEAVMGSWPREAPSDFHGKGADYPAYCVSWDVICGTGGFLDKLNAALAAELDGKHFALPTEAQWEFAAAGGKAGYNADGSRIHRFSGSDNLNAVGWYADNSEGRTHPVGQMQPNELGIYDMSGNVSEWCHDWYDLDSYWNNYYYQGCLDRGTVEDPRGPATGLTRVLRGGEAGPHSLRQDCAVSQRGDQGPDIRCSYGGFRLALSATVPVADVSLNKTTQSLEAGASETLTATVMPEDATNKNVTWTSDNEAVATVDNTGKVTAVSAGTAHITVTTKDGDFTATCEVKVNPAGTLTFTVGEGENAVTFEMVPVAGGTFLMGSQKTNPSLPNYFADADDDESPVHQVTLTQNYWMGKYEVTQGLWEAVMGSWPVEAPSDFDGIGADHPAYYVSWDDICGTGGFLDKLNAALATELGGKHFALPTEAQWEFAAAGGKAGYNADGTRRHTYSGSNDINAVAWYQHNSGEITHEVGKKAANELGIHDMSGSVWEWCAGWYGDYAAGPDIDPMGPTGGSNRVFRGGSWGYVEKYSAVSQRDNWGPGRRSGCGGLRLALSDPPATVPVTDVSLNKSTLTLFEGASETLVATITPDYATNQNVTWTSDNTAVATVDNEGAVTAVAAGTATITVTTEDGNFSAECTVTVQVIPVTGVSLNKSTLTLIEGASETLVVTIAPENAANQSVTWTSDNEAVATVDNTGKVTAVGAGAAIITVTTDDGDFTATCEVKVNPVGTLTFTIGEGENAVTFVMIPVEHGTFLMGSQWTDESGPNYNAEMSSCETPVHQVTLTQDYHIGKYEVAQGLWKAVMGSNPSGFQNGDDYPLEQVSWEEICGVDGFLVKLNAALASQLDGKKFTLPTEAQWEYAAAGGQAGHHADGSRKHPLYSGSDDINAVAWYQDNSGGQTHPVGRKQPNELAVYDMSGNVGEWCLDWYNKDSYPDGPATDPVGPETGTSRIIRGGSYGLWNGGAVSCRVSNRSRHRPEGDDSRNNNTGFRLVLSEGSYTPYTPPAPVSVTGVSLNDFNLAMGVSETIAATITPENAANKNVSWTSDNTSVATVDATGKVTGVNEGTAHIAVTTEDGGFTATCTVTVLGPLEFTVNTTSGSIVYGYPIEMVPVTNGNRKVYYIGKYEVTQQLWMSVMGNNPSVAQPSHGEPWTFWPENLDRPVENVSWNDICNPETGFLKRLNEMLASQLDGKRFALPTAAQWEFAARGGNSTHGYTYSGSNNIDEVAWYRTNAYDVGFLSPYYGTHEVGTKVPNELGIYDMSGNVAEWCQDVSEIYHGEDDHTLRRIVRGGHWARIAGWCSVSAPCDHTPDTGVDCGFRLVLILP